MRQPICLLLGLGILFASRPAPCLSPPAITPGLVRLAFPADTAIALGLDVGAISGQLCHRSKIQDMQLFAPVISARGNCGIGPSVPPEKTWTPPVEGKITVQPRETPADADRVFLHLTSFRLGSQVPLPTACGEFDFIATLDPTSDQPLSELHLEPAEGSEAKGVFSGVLRVRARLSLHPVGDGPDVDLPVLLQLPIGGPWARVGALPEESNLLLFARQEDEGWQDVPSCLSFPQPCGYFCLTAEASRLEALSAAPPP